MAKTGVEFDDAKLRRQLKQKATQLKSEAAQLLETQVQPLKDRIIYLAPKDTGLLVANVYAFVIITNKGPILFVGIEGVGYSVFVELGTEDTPAQPFLRPALAEMPAAIKRGSR